MTLVLINDVKENEQFHRDLETYHCNPRLHGSLNNGTAKDVSHGASLKQISQLTENDLEVWGVAYYIAPEYVDEMKQYLDIREQNGYTLHNVKFCVDSVPDTDEAKQVLEKSPLDSTGKRCIESFVYIGTIDNASFVGPESIEDTAAVIRECRGPSGPNDEYLFELVKAVRTLDPNGQAQDNYLEDLVAAVKQT